jgi:threonine/homoserine/homoserine lactone efflux protein
LGQDTHARLQQAGLRACSDPVTGHALAGFLAVVALITITPGPDTALVLRNSLRGSRRDGLLTAAGSASGLLVWGAASSVGVAAVLAASAAAFTVLKVLGVLYLMWMGGCALRSALRPARPDDEPAGTVEQLPPAVARRANGYVQGLMTNLLNPKAAVFFTALLPQFISAHGLSAAPIIFGLACIAATASLLGLSLYALAAFRAQRLLRARHGRRILDAVIGVVLLGLGGGLALTSE